MVEPCEEEGTSDDEQGERSVSRTIEERGVLIEMVMMSKIVSKVMLMMMDGWMDGRMAGTSADNQGERCVLMTN